MHAQMNFTLALHNLVHVYLQENQDGDSIIGEFETSKANANNHLSYTVQSLVCKDCSSTLTQKVYHANQFDMDVLTSQHNAHLPCFLPLSVFIETSEKQVKSQRGNNIQGEVL